MYTLNQRGAIAQLLVLLFLVAGIGSGVYLVKSGNLKLFSRATNPPIVFKSLDGKPLPVNKKGIPQTVSPDVRVELTSTLGPPVLSSGSAISDPIKKGTIAYRAAFNPADLNSAPFVPYLKEPTVYNVELKNTRGVQFYWVEFKAVDGKVDRRSAQIEIVFPVPKPSPTPSSTPITLGLEVGLEAGEQHDTSRVGFVAESGAAWVRLNFVGTDWSASSSNVNTYNTIINAYRNRKIKIIGLIGIQSVAGGYDRNNPDAFTQRFVDTADAIVARFGDRVKVYELFNEPNDWAGGNSAQVPPRYFAKYLGRIYRQIKITRGRSDISLNSGPLLSHDLADGADYLSSTYTEGKNLTDQLGNWTIIKSATGTYPVDGIGYHIYVAQGMGDQGQVENKIRGNLDAIKRVIVAQDPGKKIWITEFGWGTGAGRVTEDVQAQNLEKAFRVFKAETNIKMAMWFTLMDFDTAEWGLIRGDGRKKLGWTAFQRVNGLPTIMSTTEVLK